MFICYFMFVLFKNFEEYRREIKIYYFIDDILLYLRCVCVLINIDFDFFMLRKSISFYYRLNCIVGDGEKVCGERFFFLMGMDIVKRKGEDEGGNKKI